MGAPPADASTPVDGDDAPDRYRAPALDKGLDILELLSQAPQGLTRGEIVKAMGRSQSEIYRMLERLVARDYVARSLEGDRYALSLKLFVLANRHPPLNRLVALALPLMDQFAKAANQSCHLGVYDRGDLTIAAQVNSPDNWALAIRVGARINLLDTASGKVMLAFQDEDVRARMRAEHFKLSGLAADASAPDESLEAIRALGYWRGKSRQTLGVVDISAPVLGPGGGAIAALTCPFIDRIDRVGGLGAEAACESLLRAARAMSIG